MNKLEQMRTALRNIAFRTNNDWPPSKTCLVCGRSSDIGGLEYHETDCPVALDKRGEG